MHAIRLQNLSFTYPAGPTALAGIDCEIATGESVALVGPNGAGKTTLFLCLAGILPQPCGVIELAGLDPGAKENRRRLPGHVGIVFQSSEDQLFNSTVFEDVAFGPLNLGLPPDIVRERVTDALATVGLQGLEQRVPFHLSGGEKRRAALAGILAMRPEILLLDEPSTHLDPHGRRELIHLINGLSVTKMIASHDLEFVVETCPRTLVLDNGRLVADGPTRKLLADGPLMEAHRLEVPHSLAYHGPTQQHHGR